MDERIQELVTVAEDIKRLLIAVLMRNGATQGDIANVLGVNQATVSRLFSNPVSNRPRKKKNSR